MVDPDDEAVSVSTQDSTMIDDTEGAPETTPPSAPSVQPVVKKSKKDTGQLLSEVKSLADAASSATKVLSNMSQQRNKAAGKEDDKDWVFCRFLYHKFKAIPEGDCKDELQLNIQQLICQAKKQSADPSHVNSAYYQQLHSDMNRPSQPSVMAYSAPLKHFGSFESTITSERGEAQPTQCESFQSMMMRDFLLPPQSSVPQSFIDL